MAYEAAQKAKTLSVRLDVAEIDIDVKCAPFNCFLQGSMGAKPDDGVTLNVQVASYLIRSKSFGCEFADMFLKFFKT